MGKLLIDEQPLQCQPSLAAALKSADEAIVLQQLHYWLSRTNNVQSDGHKWIYNSMNDWLKQFPWIQSRNTLSSYFNDLEDRGLVVTGNFNKAKFDKTKWYRIDYDALSKLEQRLSENHSSNDQNLGNRVSNNCATNDQNQVNGMTKNRSTYTNRLPETTTRDYQETSQPAKGTHDENHQRVFDYWQYDCNWGFPSPVITQDLDEWINEFGTGLVIHAMKIAARKQVPARKADSFLNTTLGEYRKYGAKDIKAAESVDARFKRSAKSARYGGRQHIEEPLPDWAKKHGKPKKRPSKAFFDSLYDDEEG